MVSRTGKRTYTGTERASAWKQKPTLLIPQPNPASTGASPARCVGRSSCDDPNCWVALHTGLIRRPPAATSSRNCQPCNSPETVQPPGAAFRRAHRSQDTNQDTDGQEQKAPQQEQEPPWPFFEVGGDGGGSDQGKGQPQHGPHNQLHGRLSWQIS